MNTFLNNYLFRYEALVITLPVLVIFLWPDLLPNFFSSTYMPHGACYLWMPELVLLHISSDLLIGIAYIFISVTLGYLVYRASSDIPFHRMFLAFGLFIVSCGFTHLMSVLNVYEAVYWISGTVKVITAVASVLTAAALPAFIPKTLQLIKSAKLSDERKDQLEKANAELEGLNIKLKEIDSLKTSFFTNVSHELRTPLALILGPVERIINSGSMTPEYQNELITVQKNAKSLLNHVNDLLDISKLEVGKLDLRYESINISNMVRITSSYFESFAMEHNITSTLNIPEALIVHADPEKMERVFVNLFSNAYKYTPPGGNVECTMYREGNDVYFEIKDSGQGIDPSIINDLFNKYSASGKGLQRRLGSTGLGLSIVKEFIELHGGTITAENEAGGGARFTFKIPAYPPEGTVINEPKKNTAGSDSPIIVVEPENQALSRSKSEETTDTGITRDENLPTILVVEDNYEMNKLIANTLKEKFNVFCSYDGEEGLETAKKIEPDLIISDVMMPKMTGDIYLKEIRKIYNLSSVPVIMLTAKSDENLKIQLLKNGAQDYLNKPFSIEELKVRVENLIRPKLAVDILQKELKSYGSNISTLAEEITRRKKIIEVALKEKEIMLKEIHHRVKNNLQVISSLLNLQSEYITDLHALSVFQDSRDRIRSMALVHESLYQSENLDEINFAEYLKELISYLSHAYTNDDNIIEFVFECDKVYLTVEKAVPLGLIANEIITNSIKHAFPEDYSSEDRKVTVTLKSENDACLLVIQDNGRGFKPVTADSENRSLGLVLIETLLGQIEGSMKLESEDGTKYIIEFNI